MSTVKISVPAKTWTLVNTSSASGYLYPNTYPSTGKVYATFSSSLPVGVPLKDVIVAVGLDGEKVTGLGFSDAGTNRCFVYAHQSCVVAFTEGS